MADDERDDGKQPEENVSKTSAPTESTTPTSPSESPKDARKPQGLGPFTWWQVACLGIVAALFAYMVAEIPAIQACVEIDKALERGNVCLACSTYMKVSGNERIVDQYGLNLTDYKPMGGALE